MQSINELITKSSTSWAGMHAHEKRRMISSSLRRGTGRGNNCKFICLSPPRQKRKANSYFTFLSFWYALKISRDSWLSSLTPLSSGGSVCCLSVQNTYSLYVLPRNLMKNILYFRFFSTKEALQSAVLRAAKKKRWGAIWEMINFIAVRCWGVGSKCV